MVKPSPAWYALRYSIAPWSLDESLKELVQLLPRQGVDELILFQVFFDREENTRGLPELRHAEHFLPQLLRIRESLTEAGIRYSLNPWAVFVHRDTEQDVAGVFPGIQTMVGTDGTVCRTVCCPLSPVWREHVLKLWSLYARSRPHTLWLDDDFRFLNHYPIKTGCFCPLHLKLFSERAGRTVGREELVAALLAKGKPHPWRSEFLAMQGEVMAEFAGALAAAVHAVSPETHMGWMCHEPRYNCAQGTEWEKIGAALSGGKKLYIRPSLANYSETSLRGLYVSQDSIKLTRHALDMPAVDMTEIENSPMTRYSKSAGFTFLQAAISFAFGCRGITLNIYDSMGMPISGDPSYGVVLKKYKFFLNSLAERTQKYGTYRGVQLLHDDRAGFFNRLKRSDFNMMMEDGDSLVYALESLGVPTAYDKMDVVAASGQVLRPFSDDSIRSLLGKGLFLDGEAAGTLVERGFGQDIGIKSFESPRPVHEVGSFRFEEFANAEFGGGQGKYMRCMSLGEAPLQLASIKPVDGAQVISSFVPWDRAAVKIPHTFAFENSYGGRIVVQSVSLSPLPRGYLNDRRREQVQNAFRWLSYGRPAVMVSGDGVYPLGFRKDTGDSSVLGMFNLSLDPWKRVIFDISSNRSIERLEILKENGAWTDGGSLLSAEKKAGGYRITYSRKVLNGMPLFITAWWK